MTDHPELHELHRQYSDSQSKYVYFLLAAAGAAIGYALQKLEGLPLSWHVAPCLVAVACWLASLFCGCKRITWTQSTMYANFALLQMQYGLHPDQPPPHLASAAMSGVRAAIERNSNSANLYYKLQFWFLATGIASFILWRMVAMVSISAHAP